MFIGTATITDASAMPLCCFSSTRGSGNQVKWLNDHQLGQDLGSSWQQERRAIPSQQSMSPSPSSSVPSPQSHLLQQGHAPGPPRHHRQGHSSSLNPQSIDHLHRYLHRRQDGPVFAPAVQAVIRTICVIAVSDPITVVVAVGSSLSILAGSELLLSPSYTITTWSDNRYRRRHRHQDHHRKSSLHLVTEQLCRCSLGQCSRSRCLITVKAITATGFGGFKRPDCHRGPAPSCRTSWSAQSVARSSRCLHRHKTSPFVQAEVRGTRCTASWVIAVGYAISIIVNAIGAIRFSGHTTSTDGSKNNLSQRSQLQHPHHHRDHHHRWILKTSAVSGRCSESSQSASPSPSLSKRSEQSLPPVLTSAAIPVTISAR